MCLDDTDVWWSRGNLLLVSEVPGCAGLGNVCLVVSRVPMSAGPGSDVFQWSRGPLLVWGLAGLFWHGQLPLVPENAPPSLARRPSTRLSVFHTIFCPEKERCLGGRYARTSRSLSVSNKAAGMTTVTTVTVAGITPCNYCFRHSFR